jgi:alkylation response protein AidB-like acyl-CoA dehydrogenase
MSTTLERVQALAESIAAAGPEIEAARSVPVSIVDDLKAAGVFRMYVPASHGGDELAPLDAVQVLEVLSAADGSVGWIATIGANSPALFCHLAPEAYDAIYADGPDVIQAGSLVPRGRAARVDGGYRFTGQWPFASGCDHADYIAISALIDGSADDPGPRGPSGGLSRVAIVPVADVEILDTWYVSGLKGTASHDVRVDDLFVAEPWTGNVLGPPPVVRHPLDGVHPLGRLGLELAAVAVGIARGAVDDLIAIGASKRPLAGFLPRLAEDRVFQTRVGELDLDLRIARTLLHDVARTDFERVQCGRALEQRETLERRSMLSRIGDLAVGVVDGCYHASGTTGLYESSALQRRLRDVHAVVQHILFTANALAPLGALLLGEPVEGGLAAF